MDEFRRRYREIIKPKLMFSDEDREIQNDTEIDFLLNEISKLIEEKTCCQYKNEINYNITSSYKTAV